MNAGGRAGRHRPVKIPQRHLRRDDRHVLVVHPDPSSSLTPELLKGSFQVVDNLGRKNVRFGQAIDVLQAVVLQPEDIQVQLIPMGEFVVAEPSETFGFPALMITIGLRICWATRG